MSQPSFVAQARLRFQGSETARRLSGALLWGSLASILGRGLPLVSMMLAARILGPTEFGKLTLLYSTTLAIQVFIEVGLSVTCTKYVADFHRKDPVRTGRLIDLANVVSALTAFLIVVPIVFFREWFAANALAAPDLTGQLYWCAVLVIVSAFSAVQQGILVGFEAFRAIASIESAGGLGILLLVPLGATRYGVQGAFGAMVFGYGLRLIAQHFAVTRQTSKLGIIRRWTLPVSEIPVLWRFSLPAMLNSLLGGPATWCAISIIAHQTNGHAEVGVFNAANQWFSLLQFLPTIMTQVSFPILTERLNAGAANAAWKLFCGQILVTIGIVTVAVIVVILMSPFIMGFYGFQYADKWPILIAVAIASWFAAPQGPMGNLIIAHEMPWSWFVDSVLWAGCLIVVVCIFRSRGAIALAWGHVAAYAVRGLFASVQVHQLRTNTNKQ